MTITTKLNDLIHEIETVMEDKSINPLLQIVMKTWAKELTEIYEGVYAAKMSALGQAAIAANEAGYDSFTHDGREHSITDANRLHKLAKVIRRGMGDDLYETIIHECTQPIN